MQKATANPISRMRRILQTLCGIAVFLAFMFSWLWTLTFINRLTLLRHKEHYKPATFVVTAGNYSRGGEGGDFWWLTGEVNGWEERLVPRLKVSPHSAPELLSQFPKGTHIEVLYDPDATETLVQGESLRVIEATSDFWQREERLRNRLAPLVLLPGPITLAIYLTVRYLNRRARKSASAR